MKSPVIFKLLKVSEFSKLINVHPQTLRRWHLSNTLRPVCIGSNGERFYDNSQVKLAKTIKKDTVNGKRKPARRTKSP